VADLGVPVPFQITLRPPPSVSLTGLGISQLLLEFGDENSPRVEIEHDPTGSTMSANLAERIDVGALVGRDGASSTKAKANLRWPEGSYKLVTGTVNSAVPSKLKVSYHRG
jgi:hypothetical protein